MGYDLDKIRASREERRKRMLAAAQAEEGSNDKQHTEAVDEKPEPVAPVLERRRRTTRDAAISDTVEEKVSQEPLSKPEPESVDVVSVNGKEVAVYEAPKPEVLTSTGIDDALVSRVVAEVRKAVREELKKLHIRFDEDVEVQIHGLTEDAIQTLQKKFEKPARKPRQPRERQVESEGYKKFKAEWHKMTKEQRLARAKEVGAKWNHSEDSVIDAMRMQMAVREKLGVEKYQ